MKTLILLGLTLISLSVFAATEQIQCVNMSNSDEMLEISYDHQANKVLGVSLFNIDWSQRPQDHYQGIKSSETLDSSVALSLTDGTLVLMSSSVLQAGHKGEVHVNGDSYSSCF